MLTFMIYKDNAHEHDVYDDGQEDDLWVHGGDAVLKSKFQAPPKQGGHIECILMMEMREPDVGDDREDENDLIEYKPGMER